VNVLAGRRSITVSRPSGSAPGHLLDFFLDAGPERRVCDIGVDLHQEIAADDHRLGFRMVYVAGMMARPRATSSRTNSGVINSEHGAEGRPDAGASITSESWSAALVLADGDELHLGRDYAAARIGIWVTFIAGLRASRRALQLSASAPSAGFLQAHASENR